MSQARETVKLLKIRASQGHPEAAESVVRWLTMFPELKAEARELDAMADRAEAAWAAAVGFGDPLAERAARAEAASVRAELVGDAPSLLERVLASAVVVAHLAHQRAAVMAARTAEHTGVRAARERVLSAAQTRLAAAVKAFRLVAKKKAKGVRPRRKLKVFEPAAAG